MILAYLGLFGVSLGAATILPLGSEPAFVALVGAQGSLWLPLLVASAGNVLGSLINFWMGWKAGEFAAARSGKAERFVRSAALVRRWGPPALALAWVPVIGDALVAVAGALRMPPGRCLLWMAAGKIGRYAALGWATLAVLGG